MRVVWVFPKELTLALHRGQKLLDPPPDPELDYRRDDNVAEFYQGALDLVHHINALPDITCEVKSSLIILHVWRLIPQPI